MSYKDCDGCGYPTASSALDYCEDCHREWTEQSGFPDRRKPDQSVLAMSRECVEILRELRDRPDYGGRLAYLLQQTQRALNLLEVEYLTTGGAAASQVHVAKGILKHAIHIATEGQDE